MPILDLELDADHEPLFNREASDCTTCTLLPSSGEDSDEEEELKEEDGRSPIHKQVTQEPLYEGGEPEKSKANSDGSFDISDEEEGA